MKRYTILGLFALVCLASLAYADTCTTSYTSVSTFVAGGAGGSAANNITTNCAVDVPGLNGNTTPLLTDPTAARVSFLNTPGQAYLDTINWEVNQNDCGGGVPLYCNNPEYFDNQQGNGIQPYPSPPYGGGVNGTGYSLGDTGDVGNTNVLDLGVTSAEGSLPLYSNTNILTGLLQSGSDPAFTWDTSTTGATYVTDGGVSEDDTADYSECTGGSYNQNCWIFGANSFAAISGVGFDVQLLNGGQLGQQFNVTFAIYGQTPNCSTEEALGFSEVITGTEVPDIDCYDYQDNQMTDAGGNDVPNDCNATNFPGPGPTYPDPSDTYNPNCVDYTDNTVQLLGTVTVNSDSNGDPVFFGFTTTDPYGVGAIVLTGGSVPGGEFSNTNFAINEVTLLTQQPASTPEPATLLLFGSGLLIAARRLRKHAAK